ncbi:hypothetical protein C7475_102264 [Chitinophaga sp. S165]|nr:hypothetical protein C7475_102264 [Chitinophaga sp. S165]
MSLMGYYETNSPLQLASEGIQVQKAISLPIRYGCLSSKHGDTCGIILSNHSTTLPGQAYIAPIRYTIKNAKILENHAFALSAVGLSYEREFSLNRSWGTVGLLINPNIDTKDKRSADVIRNRWAKIYESYQTFDYTQYRIEKDEVPVIDENGFIQIPWTDEMNEFDFILVPAFMPNPQRILSAREIAEQMAAKDYRLYFDKNREHNVQTFQDENILDILNGTETKM